MTSKTDRELAVETKTERELAVETKTERDIANDIKNGLAVADEGKTAREIERRKREAAEVEVLARTIYGEARGERLPGKEAIASVVLNRVKRALERGGRYWWGGSTIEVCQKAWQFSCWNAGDPNREKIQVVTEDNSVFATCLRIARRAVGGELEDATKGATHYHAKTVHPPWAWRQKPSAEIGGHLFYNAVE